MTDTQETGKGAEPICKNCQYPKSAHEGSRWCTPQDLQKKCSFYQPDETCPRCGLGDDTDGDGHCAVCARMTDEMVAAKVEPVEPMSERIEAKNEVCSTRSPHPAHVWDIPNRYCPGVVGGACNSSQHSHHAHEKTSGCLGWEPVLHPIPSRTMR